MGDVANVELADESYFEKIPGLYNNLVYDT
jgi:hypothetical protein